MPIYEYKCAGCNQVFELRRSYGEMDAPASCPRCDGQGKRLVSTVGCKVGSYLKPPAGPAFRGSSPKVRTK